jgi:ribonuclease HI
MNGGKKLKPCSRRPKQRKYAGTEVDRMCRNKKQEELLKTVPMCSMEGKELAYKLECEYLGTMQQGDGGCDKDVTRRLALARVKYNELMWLWHANDISIDLKMRIYESNVLSSVVWGSEGWLLTETIQKRLNGWNSRCVSLITGKTAREEASPRTQSMCLPGIIRFRRMVWLGHLLRGAEGCLERRVVLRYAELVRRKVVKEPGDILMDAPAHSNNDQLIGMAGGAGTVEEREVARKQWKEWCTRRLSTADRDRKKRRHERVPSASIKANTVEETAAALENIVHKWRIYSDGGCDGNGAKGIWGKAGYGAAIYLVQDDGSVKEISDLCGPVVTEASSVWWMGAERGTNQTGELCGVMQGLLWLLEYAADDTSDVAICVDSLYAGNELEGFWRKNCNAELITEGQSLLARVRTTRNVTFVHVKGHSADGGNDRADDLVQVGKSEGPFSRMRLGGGGEGAGRTGLVASLEKKDKEDDPVGDDDGETERQQYVFDQMEAMTSEDGLQADERMRDSIGSAGSVLLASAWADESEEEEDEGEEIVEAEEQIARVTEQIASGGTGDRGESMEDIMQLERVTVAAGQLSVVPVTNAPVVDLCRRMQRCWISTIGYRVQQAPRQFVVCDKYRSFVINVQGGS